MLRKFFRDISPLACAVVVFSSVFQAFGIYHVHAVSGVTEGGVLGATLLLQHWFDISPAVSSFVFNVILYVVAYFIHRTSVSPVTLANTITKSI